MRHHLDADDLRAADLRRLQAARTADGALALAGHRHRAGRDRRREAAAPPDEGLELLLRHLATFWDRLRASNVLLVHYSDLQADLDGEMRRLAGRLDIAISTNSWAHLVAQARLDRMRERAGELAPQVTIDGLWPDARRFFNHGGSGQWRTLIGPAELRRYETRVHQLAAPDLASWVHRTLSHP